jgi:hypothetical protein
MQAQFIETASNGPKSANKENTGMAVTPLDEPKPPSELSLLNRSICKFFPGEPTFNTASARTKLSEWQRELAHNCSDNEEEAYEQVPKRQAVRDLSALKDVIQRLEEEVGGSEQGVCVRESQTHLAKKKRK